MKKILISLVFSLLLLFGPSLLTASAIENNWVLETKISEIIEKEIISNGAIASISVRDSENGKLLFDYNGDTRMRPASNMKLLTVASGLHHLGKDYTFQTLVQTDGKMKKHTLDGHIYVKGNGDPTLTVEVVEDMARKVKMAGIEKVKGDLIVDDSSYDSIRYPVDLPWSDEEMKYAPNISALTFTPNSELDIGTIFIDICPNKKVGKKAIVTSQPKASYPPILNKTKTVHSDKNKGITVTRKHGSDTIIVEGEIDLTSEKSQTQIAIWDPTYMTGLLFKEQLEEQGITVKGEVTKGEAPAHSLVIVRHSSPPLTHIVTSLMKHSNNGISEMLIKELGKSQKGTGSWESGLDVVTDTIKSFGIDPNTMIIRDGSGLSHVNGIPANELTNFLYVIQKEGWFDDFFHTLPVAGIEDETIGGTLSDRMNHGQTKGNVFAKTGTLSTVSSLSGYVTTRNENTLIFSILLNQLKETDGKEIEDHIVSILADL
ncbi:D-alanyl-D-alanine carboxypeptidase/D-alanyl-D-alanine-endopeptidase [Alkalihalobacillus sp. LMS39]|uniref:D-alanyl-D-alanine carboxypeptidase/D-alanyl-D-alanine endopeptidase n=1 Tax=Alkalihalobacillus sp. LMS39 TaxID=2924032 RepID=UPI001FB205E3|nr:D-alanyl-D-alanine carboxypeptidase/D-alanyl-D-alanine-endopeptidase [Alkalihalobacillus sp. LMS39]UOE92094.1 D-alanyl-D-alanine carboxypeptidase/D-alanyl-D-alanine-endopeptidase [Alkalihalobacillus sp. LMS39]